MSVHAWNAHYARTDWKRSEGTDVERTLVHKYDADLEGGKITGHGSYGTARKRRGARRRKRAFRDPHSGGQDSPGSSMARSIGRHRMPTPAYLGYPFGMLELLGILGGVCIVGIVVSLKLARTSLERDPVGALLDAAFQGDTGTVTYLLDHGVDVNASRASAPGVTALHGAVMGNSRACVELLISRGADLEAHPAPDPNGDRDTPLAHAVSQACDSVAQKDGIPGEESTEMVELLLAAGADPEPGLQALRPYQATDGNDTPLASLLRAAQRRR